MGEPYPSVRARGQAGRLWHLNWHPPASTQSPAVTVSGKCLKESQYCCLSG